MADTAQDVVDVLTGQHEQISRLIEQLRTGRGDRQLRFDELVHLLAVHEAVEEEIVHPVARHAHFNADAVVDPRLAEEKHAKHALAELYDLGVDHPEFDTKMSEFADAMAAHAEHEETEEFTLLRKQYAATQLENMAQQVRLAETLAPTRPHPHTGESVGANMVAGPPLAVYDRIRDAFRKGRTGSEEARPNVPRHYTIDGTRRTVRGYRFRRRSHSGESLEDNANLPGIVLIFIGVAVLGLTVTAAGYGFMGWTIIGGVVGVVCLAVGTTWVLVERRRLRRSYRLPPNEQPHKN